MTHSYHFLFSFLFTCFSFIVVGQNFEGKVIIKNTIPNSLNGTFALKEDIARLDATTPRESLTMLSNASTGEKITIRERANEKIAVVKNSNDMMQYRNVNKNYTKKGRRTIPNVMVKVTRETKNINGYKCYKVVAKDNKYEGEAWITKNLDINITDVFPIIKTHQRAMPIVAKALENSMEGFVMEMTLKNLNTNQIDNMTVTVKQYDLEDKYFEIDMEDIIVYDENSVRELMKDAKGNPTKMRNARTIMGQLRMQ